MATKRAGAIEHRAASENVTPREEISRARGLGQVSRIAATESDTCTAPKTHRRNTRSETKGAEGALHASSGIARGGNSALGTAKLVDVGGSASDISIWKAAAAANAAATGYRLNNSDATALCIIRASACVMRDNNAQTRPMANGGGC